MILPASSPRARVFGCCGDGDFPRSRSDAGDVSGRSAVLPFGREDALPFNRAVWSRRRVESRPPAQATGKLSSKEAGTAGSGPWLNERLMAAPGRFDDHRGFRRRIAMVTCCSVEIFGKRAFFRALALHYQIAIFASP